MRSFLEKSSERERGTAREFWPRRTWWPWHGGFPAELVEAVDEDVAARLIICNYFGYTILRTSRAAMEATGWVKVP